MISKMISILQGTVDNNQGLDCLTGLKDLDLNIADNQTFDCKPLTWSANYAW